jgi:hypothetical protein
MAKTQKSQKGASGGVRCSHCGEILVVMHKLEEVIEKFCSDILVIYHRKYRHGRM